MRLNPVTDGSFSAQAYTQVQAYTEIFLTHSLDTAIYKIYTVGLINVVLTKRHSHIQPYRLHSLRRYTSGIHGTLYILRRSNKNLGMELGFFQGRRITGSTEFLRVTACMLSAHRPLRHCNSVCLSVSDTDGSVGNGASQDHEILTVGCQKNFCDKFSCRWVRGFLSNDSVKRVSLPLKKSIFYRYWFVQRENCCRQTQTCCLS